jgi:hypothetical protein
MNDGTEFLMTTKQQRSGARSVLGVKLTVFVGLVLLHSCGREDRSEQQPRNDSEKEKPAVVAAGADVPVFREVAEESGLTFVHFNGMSGQLYYSEIMGSGVALFDYDNDDDLDIYLVQGSMLEPGAALSDATFPPSPEQLPLHDRLFRNDLMVDEEGARTLKFTDVTEASKIRAPGYGMGVTAADFNNDGWTDLYLTNAGTNQMFLNNGDGTFVDVSVSSRTDDSLWGLSATAFDYDRDGWLDLYVANYVDFEVATNLQCRSLTGAPDYCGPQAYAAVEDRLFRNLGGGKFEDFTERAGIAAEVAAGMGVVSGDFDQDGWPDIYVSNDGMPNLMWLNQHDGTFVNRAPQMGVGLNREGLAEAGMGIAASDIDGDGGEDLLVTNLTQETNTFYRSRGTAFFEDDSIASGLGSPSWPFTSFGTAWIDIWNRGSEDLVAVSGSVLLIPDLVDRGDPYPLHMPNQLFRNMGTGRYELANNLAPQVFERSEVSRGLARGDIDNDGDIDLVISNNSGPVRLLQNTVGQNGHWIGLKLIGDEVGQDMLGAVVEIEAGSPKIVKRRVRTGGSYLSSHDPRIHFGISEVERIHEVTVEWPRGERERFAIEVDSYQTLQQGEGKPEPSG